MVSCLYTTGSMVLYSDAEILDVCRLASSDCKSLELTLNTLRSDCPSTGVTCSLNCILDTNALAFWILLSFRSAKSSISIWVLQEPTVMVNTIIANNSFFILYGFLVSCLLFGFWAVSPLGSWVCRILSVVRCDEAEISVLSLIDCYSGQS